MSLLNLFGIHFVKNAAPKQVASLNAFLWQRNLSNEEKKKTDGEINIENVLKKSFPKAEKVQVTDISGGCGDMYEICIESFDFKGKRTIEQHKLITNALKDEVSKMHGLRIFTSIPG